MAVSIFFFRSSIVWPVPSRRKLAISRVMVVARAPPPAPIPPPVSLASESCRRGLLTIGRSSLGLRTMDRELKTAASLPVLATWRMAAGPSLLISVILLKRCGPPRIIMAIWSPCGPAGKYLSLSSFLAWNGDRGLSLPGASVSRRTILPLRSRPLSSSNPADGSVMP